MLVKPLCTAKKRPSSMATISAQPMLRPSLSHPGTSLQASHSSSNIMPIPQDEEASTQNSMEDVGGGFDNDEPQKSVDNSIRHHAMSANTLGLGDKEI